MSRIAVIGGGITGLSACHFARKLLPSSKVTLFEKSSRFGGWINTLHVPIALTETEQHLIPLELGPNSIRGGTDDKCKLVAKLISDLNLCDDVVAPSDSAKHRFVYHKHKMSKIEHIVRRFALSAMTWIPLHQFYYYVQGGHRNRHCDESIQEFFTRNFGAQLTHTLASSFVNGVYGGGIDQLSMEACSPFNRIKQLEQKYGSYFFGAILAMLERNQTKQEDTGQDEISASIESMMHDLSMDMSKLTSFTFTNGLQQMVDALWTQLRQEQAEDANEMVQLHRNVELLSMRYCDDKQCMSLHAQSNTLEHAQQHFEFDYVINAVQPRHASTLLDVDLNAFNLSSSLVTVNVVFKNKEFVQRVRSKFDGFGVLIPRAPLSTSGADNVRMQYDAENSLLGIIYYSSIFPLFDESEYDNHALSLVFMFGGPRFDVHSMSNAEIVDCCKRKLQQMYDINVSEMHQETAELKEIVCDVSQCDIDDVQQQTYSMHNSQYSKADVLYNINRLHNAIDHYQVGHLEKLRDLRAHMDDVYHGKVLLAGCGYDGVGIPDSILSAYRSVHAISKKVAPQQEQRKSS